MAVREIRLFGDPVLRTVSDQITEIDDSIRALIKDLEETTALPGRAGVAAPQIGVNLRAFSYNVEGVIGHLINPVLIETAGEKVNLQEGCLSLPEIWSEAPRFEKVLVRGVLVSGEETEFWSEGLMAQVMQHEIDHLEGLTYIDRLEKDQRRAAMAALRQTSWF